MPCPLLTPANLAAGIANFMRHPKWRQDFHNTFYSNVTNTAQLARGFAGPSVGSYKSARHYGPSLWHDIVGELQFWKALRPHPRAIFNAPLGLRALSAAYTVFGAGLPYATLPVAHPPQAPIQNLFQAAAALKVAGRPSAVFPSKCCHMLLPWEFPIWDNSFAGNTGTTRQKMVDSLDGWDGFAPAMARRLRTAFGGHLGYPANYWTYREFILLAWDTLPLANQAVLIQQMNAAIIAGGAPVVWPHFPYRTKIPELCLA